MGQTLSSPATEKLSESGGNERFLYAVSEMQGWRITMEDSHAIALDLDGTEAESNTFFAVYDGHGGGKVAKFAGKNVHKRLVTEEAYREKQYETALKRAFLGTDEDLLADPAHTRDPSGCTAVAALVTSGNKILVANAGDSRSVLSSKGVVKPLSFDHKPSNEVEKARISSAGGYIEYGRVNGNLALSRALGDFDFKKNYNLIPENQIITANPDVTTHEITSEDEFLVLACDGIWDCLSSQDVVNFVRRKVWEKIELHEIGEMLCDHCLAPDTNSGAGIGCDNMTVLIVALLQGRTKEEWYEWMHDRVERSHGFDTPMEPPQIYSPYRLMSFKAHREAQAERERQRQERGESPSNSLFGGSGTFGSFTRVLGSTGGISFHPGSGIVSDTGTLMFGTDDSDDEDSLDDEMDIDGSDTSRPFFGHSLGVGNDSPDATRSLKEKLAAFERDNDEDAFMNNGVNPLTLDGDTQSTSTTSTEDPHPPAPPSPTSPKVNGNAKIPHSPSSSQSG